VVVVALLLLVFVALFTSDPKFCFLHMIEKAGPQATPQRDKKLLKNSASGVDKAASDL